MPPEPTIFELTLPPMTLEAGARVQRHEIRGWHWGPAEDQHWLAARSRPLSAEQTVGVGEVVRRAVGHRAPPAAASTMAPPALDTVLVVHALTGDMRAGGPGGWWAPLVGPGRALDPTRCRVLCFNNLGSCYGSSGPADPDFPTRSDDARHDPVLLTGKGAFRLDDAALPATITTWDVARSLLQALDGLGISKVQLAVGGSVGAMIVLCLAALAPERFERIVPMAGAEAASAWVLGWSHVGRQAILMDPGFPEDATRGLELARQIAHLSYRAEAGLTDRQGRVGATAEPDALSEPLAWSSRRPYRVQTYLEHHGRKLLARFDGRAYLAQMDAMDHHDLARRPPAPEPMESWSVEAPAAPPSSGPVRTRGLTVHPTDPAESWGLARIRAAVLAVSIDSDQLFFPAHMVALAERLAALGCRVEHRQLASAHGHDAFLIEWDQVAAVLERVWDM